MARTKSENKGPGRLRQMWDVFQMTRRIDKRAVWYLLLALIVPIAAGIVLALIVAGGNPVTMVLWIVAGVLAGVLAALIVLGRRAERAAYSQIEGQQGAVGAVMRSSLRRGWRGSENPVAFNKSRDAVYRAVGRGGVVLISEGPGTRVKRLVDDERRKVNRLVPNVPVTVIKVGPDEDSVRLRKLAREMSKVKPKLSRAEVLAVSKRLDSMDATTPLPIPKGIDPMKVRPQRAR